MNPHLNIFVQTHTSIGIDCSAIRTRQRAQGAACTCWTLAPCDVAYSDGVPSGAFGCWKRGISETWSAKNGQDFTETERAEWRRCMDDARRQRAAEEAKRHAEASSKAAVIWGEAKPASGAHPYLARKGVKALGLRVHEGTLVIPMRDGDELHSLQFIAGDGAKRFLTGGRGARVLFQHWQA